MKKIVSNIPILTIKQNFTISLILVFGILLGNCVFQNTAVASEGLNSEACITNTIDEPQCKDCCDCLDDPDERKDCRDRCAVNDFSNNTDFITVDAPSILGPDGDYSAALNAGSEQAAKAYCDQSDDLACGDRRHCRDAVNAAFGDANTDSDPNAPPNDQVNDQNNNTNISITQAISDEAQMKTIAFDGLAFLTGDLCSDTFFPPGKVSDFFGFQYMRDITPNGFGHNTEFAGRISDSVLAILTDAQVQSLVAMANTQGEQIDAYGYERFVLIKAFRRLLENDLPEGVDGLDKSAVMEFAADLYEIDGEISFDRAKVLGDIVAELTNTQKSELTKLQNTFNELFYEAGEGGVINSDEWPEAAQVNLSGLASNDGRVLVSTYATQLFSWYLGSVEGDIYFCPERHGTYFGSFYMKDIPPISATEAVTIDTNLTADMGSDFFNILDDTQEALVTDLVDIQRSTLNNIVSKREEIAQKLRLFMDGISVDKDEVLALVRQYGEFDGEIVYSYATSFAAVEHTLTNIQADTVMGLRLNYYERFPDYQANSNAYDCSGAWLYASKVGMPDIINTDFLFGVGQKPDTDIDDDDDDDDDSNDNVTDSIVKEGAQIILLEDGFSFAEGPAVNKDGDLYFSDILADRIYQWSSSKGVTLFKDNSGGANGLFFDSNDNLVVCEGENQRIISIDSAGNMSVLTEEYNNIAYNEPNDLWIDSKGGIYFSDPIYNSSLSQDGEHVYYLTPNRDNLVRVVNDMVKPNGIAGNEDGTILYVADHGAGNTYKYSINQNGSLSDKQLFAPIGADGMTIDSEGNVFLCEKNVLIYDSSGNFMESINVPEQPTNVCFGDKDMKTLFITTRSALYSLQMRVSGISKTINTETVDCLIFDDDLSLTINCTEYNGIKYQCIFRLNPTLSGMLWKLDYAAPLIDNSSSSCLSFGNDLSLAIQCAEYKGVKYSFTLNHYPDQSGELLWQLDESSLRQYMEPAKMF